MLRRTLTLLLFLSASIIIFAQRNVRPDNVRKSARERKNAAQAKVANDTVQARYPISKTAPDNIKDLERHALDLKTPDNIVTDTTYNEKDSTYTITTRLGKGTCYISEALAAKPISCWFNGMEPKDL